MQVAQAFDGAKFNFTKALQKEVLVQFEPVLEKQPAYEAKVQTSLLPCNQRQCCTTLDIRLSA